jgi:hypothetical protein
VKTSLPLAVMLGGLAFVAGPRAARADGTTDGASAMTLFDKARDLRARGRCADALPLFEKAYALYPPGLGSLRNIAVCQEALGHIASARAAWLDLRRAVVASSDGKYAGWTDDADHEMARLAPKVASFTLDVAVVDAAGDAAPAASSDGLTVSVDGHALAKDRVETVIEHDPGTVVVRASGAGFTGPDEQALTLGAGESRRVVLHLTLVPAAPAATEPVAAATQVESSGSRASPLRTGAWVALGVGIAGLAGAAASFAVRQSALASLRSSCPGYASAPCDTTNEAAVQSDVDSGRVASASFSVLGVVGIAGAVASVTLFAVSSASSGSSAVVVTPTGFAALGTF